MALSLTAEQKNISSLFYNEDQYIIPEFQRPYCWTYDTCYQLYTDIMTYYYAQEDFFVGNIVMARSDDHQNKPQVVDGQQRMITLWLWMKSFANSTSKCKITKCFCKSTPLVLRNSIFFLVSH